MKNNRSGMRQSPNQSVQPTGGSRFAQPVLGRQRRLPPVADAFRWPDRSPTVKSILTCVLAALVLCGCASGPAVSRSATGNLEINVVAPPDMPVAFARIFVDGVFIGNVSQSRPILFLKRGVRAIRVELPGTKTYEQGIAILGDPNHQVLNVMLEKM